METFPAFLFAVDLLKNEKAESKMLPAFP